MPELRRDPVTGTWVIVSPERSIRPQFYTAGGDVELLPGDCPFCEGNENMTPPEVYSLRESGSHGNKPGWKVRVVPNKYPALRVEGDLNREGEGFYDKMNGIGAHEVVIETTDHEKGMDELSVDEVADIFLTFKHRILDLKRDVRFKYIQVFKNHGAKAGATIPHPHSQMVALPMVPGVIHEKLSRAGDHFRERERCIYCDIIHYETGYRKRVLVENSDYIVIAPFASGFPFELAVYPVGHESSFEEMGDALFKSLAEVMREVVGRISGALERPDYNLVLHNAPFDRDAVDYFHWHLQLVPVISGTGGFELGTYSTINPTPPEEAIQTLKRTPFP
ncbi:MAG: galactose-1-phosphate uridylyltransferase [bacterium]|nr:galactose-1-phosphate uridylyltransferase [bacterium]